MNYDKISEKNKKKVMWDLIWEYVNQWDTPLDVMEEIYEFLKTNYKSNDERKAHKEAEAAKAKKKK